MKNTFLFLLLSVFALNSFAQEEDQILKIKDQLSSYFTSYPIEKIFLSSDKEVYKPGEIIWLSGMVSNIDGQGLASVSPNLDVELYDESGVQLQSISYALSQGIAKGNMEVPANLSKGKYILVASTSYMSSADEAFMKLIFVDEMDEDEMITEEINLPKLLIAGQSNRVELSFQELSGKAYSSKKVTYELYADNDLVLDGKTKTGDNGEVTINLDIPDKEYQNSLLLKVTNSKDLNYSHRFHVNTEELQVKFFAEGGNFVAGTPLIVGFMVTNNSGQPVDVSSEIVADGATITQARTLVSGYGIFNLQAEASKKYQFKIGSGLGAGQVFDLPTFAQDGFVCSIQKTDTEYIYANLIFTDGNTHEVNLMATRGSQLFWASKMNVNGAVRIKIPKETFEQGLCLFSVFDKDGERIGDRLFYVDKGESLSVSLDVDKDVVSGGQPLKIKIQSKIKDGASAAGVLAVSVSSTEKIVNRIADFIPSFTLNSLVENYILETSSLINEGSFTENAMNYILVSNSFKNYSWDSILKYDANKQNSGRDNVSFFANLSEQVKRFSLMMAFEKTPQATTSFYADNQSLFSKISKSSSKSAKPNRYIELLHSGTSILDVIKMMKPYRLEGDKIIFGGGPNSFYGQEGALIIIDGIKMGSSTSALELIPGADITSISVSSDPNDIMQYTSLNSIGIVVITTTEPMKATDLSSSSQGSQSIPDNFVEYLLDIGNENQTTLYWDPLMEIDEFGTGSIDVLTNRVVGSYQVDVHIITENGQVGQSSKTFTVK